MLCAIYTHQYVHIVTTLPKKVERLFSSRPHDGGAWPAGQPSGPAEPGAGAARLSEHRVEGRSLSDLRPDDQFRCTARAGFSDSRMLCLQWVVGLGTGPAQALLSCDCERQQTSMRSGSGLLPGPTLRAPRARWGQKLGTGMATLCQW